MSNLIVTVIAIALVAVAALASLYYVSDILSNSTVKARAATLISESRQLMSANTQYLVDNRLQSFDDFGVDAPAIANYTNGRVPILGLPILQNGTSWGAALSSGATVHWACNNKYNWYDNQSILYLDGTPIAIQRTSCRIDGQDAINYTLSSANTANGCTAQLTTYDITNAASVKHPLVKMCLNINSMAALPTGLTYAANGLPFATSATNSCRGNSGKLGGGQFNYCYIGASSGSTYILKYVFTN